VGGHIPAQLLDCKKDMSTRANTADHRGVKPRPVLKRDCESKAPSFRSRDTIHEWVNAKARYQRTVDGVHAGRTNGFENDAWVKRDQSSSERVNACSSPTFVRLSNRPLRNY
jgi:hypothetical protein